MPPVLGGTEHKHFYTVYFEKLYLDAVDVILENSLEYGFFLNEKNTLWNAIITF